MTTGTEQFRSRRDLWHDGKPRPPVRGPFCGDPIHRQTGTKTGIEE